MPPFWEQDACAVTEAGRGKVVIGADTKRPESRKNDPIARSKRASTKMMDVFFHGNIFFEELIEFIVSQGACFQFFAAGEGAVYKKKKKADVSVERSVFHYTGTNAFFIRDKSMGRLIKKT